MQLRKGGCERSTGSGVKRIAAKVQFLQRCQAGADGGEGGRGR